MQTDRDLAKKNNVYYYKTAWGLTQDWSTKTYEDYYKRFSYRSIGKAFQVSFSAS